MRSSKKRKKQKKAVTTFSHVSKSKAKERNERESKMSKRKVISRLHTIMKESEKVKQDPNIPPDEKKMKIQQFEQKIEELGGLQAYQQSSLLGEHLHGNVNSSKWVLQKLKEHNVRAAKILDFLCDPFVTVLSLTINHRMIGCQRQGCKLNLLDVGALQLNYTKHTKWLDIEAIDLNPQCDGIIKADFFQYKVDQSAIFDIIVLSLVLNFVSSPPQRGEMLKRCQKLCKQDGYVFVVLPRACLENSRYLDHALFEQMMDSLNFDLITQHDSKKLSFKMFRKAEKRKDNGEKKMTFAKHEVRNGKRCNNFCIVMR